jgi:HAD superfamily hydrolase (TIGR01490 family)
MNQRIAFFDFDGTITTKDTLLEFVKFSKGSLRFYLGFLLTSPWMVAYKLKLTSNHKAKEKFLTWFFSNTPQPVFQDWCTRFAAEIIPGLIRPKALTEIAKLQELGATVVIVSASPENWIKPWSEPMGLQLIATRLTLKKEKLTGMIEGRNCHGKEKVSRIKENYTLSDYNEILAYGDTSGDRPMLDLAAISFYQPFR